MLNLDIKLGCKIGHNRQRGKESEIEYLSRKQLRKGKHVHFCLMQEDKRNTLPYTNFAASP